MWELIVELSYILDVIIYANTGLAHRGGSIDMNKKTVRNHYCKTWLFIDVLSIIPMNLLLHLFFPEQLNKLAWNETNFYLLFRCVNLIKITKLSATVKISYILEHFKSYYDDRYAYQNVF